MTQKEQIEIFKKGFPSLDIVEAASVGHGIEKADEAQIDSYIAYNSKASVNGRCKFVPASGAASRMFKDVFAHKPSTINELAQNIEEFAFYDEKVFGKRPYDADKTADMLLLPMGLDYGSKPKGVLLFHKYKYEVRTALAEHLVEGKEYMRNADKSVNICFTVSPEHLKLFKKALEHVWEEFEQRYGVKYNITFTFQDPKTDTIAVTPDNEPFLKEDGSILTRPAGHGALIYELNKINEELISIKNIDNVAHERLLPICSRYKKALMGKALLLRDKVFDYIEKLEKETLSEELCNEIESFLSSQFCLILPKQDSLQLKKELLLSKLNRPIRVCGMVKNEGEPGGGPFIIKDKDGCTSLQILESVQIKDASLMAKATHFNPVDLICLTHNNKREKFDLTKYVDPSTGFISSKSYQGRELKALELPGLWNGAMSDWLTAFMEVPIETFNPVKVVLDLLKAAHKE